MIPEEQAIEIVLSAAQRLDSEEVPAGDAAGRALAEAVVSDIDMPPFHKAAMDGFAVRSEDLLHSPATLRVVGEIPAGVFPEFSVGPGEAARIMTGAPMPEGADAVQMVEKTSGYDGSTVEIYKSVAPREHVCLKGEDLTAGQEVLATGRAVGPAEIGILASVGHSSVRVYRAPEVAIFATGDELVAPEERPKRGHIRNSNSSILSALVRAAGGRPREMGIVRDEIDSLRQAGREGLTANMLLVSGGVSAGQYDLVAQVLDSLGVRILFHRVAIKPGKPLLFGAKNGTLIFGLPGNPVSGLVTFRLFVEPAIRTMMGLRSASMTRLAGILDEDLQKKPDRTWYMPARIRSQDGELRVKVLDTHGSADLGGFALGNAMLVAPRKVSLIPAGSEVTILVGGDFAD
ncbi:MAG: molybdopterin molybdotransferase MoeA [Candidatus Eisenbacteria sp.]|nr:molybdopterin molybdotransferase MoeA [Candidatus Eisenbacteria bacterium]